MSTRQRERPVLTALAGTVVAVVALLTTSPPVIAAEEPAADSVTWGVQPSSPDGPDGRITFDYQVAPGSVITDWVSVRNDSADPATFRVYAADAVTDYDTAAFTLVGAEEASTGLGGWIQIDGGPASCPDSDDRAEADCAAGLGATLTIGPGTRADIPITITVPQNATPGDHSAGIVASYVSQATQEGTAVRREDRVGARVYLRVDGALSPGLGTSGFVAGYDGTVNPFDAGTGRVGFDVSNLGNTRLSAQPVATLTGPFGIALGTFELDAVRNLVPGGVAHVTAERSGIPPLLLMFADITVSPAPADGVAAGDPLPAPVTMTAVAWAVPWTLLAIVAVIAVALAGTVWWRRRRRDLLAADLADYAARIRAEEREGVRDEPEHVTT